jgi:hypothetical protein
MAETVGSLVDKLMTVAMKLWHQEEIAHEPAADDKTVAGAKRKINVLNNQRNALIQEIDEQLSLSITNGKALVFDQMKDYSKGK